MLTVLIPLIAALLIAGVLLWALARFPVLDPTLATIARIIIIVVVAIYCIKILAAWAGHPIF